MSATSARGRRALTGIAVTAAGALLLTAAKPVTPHTPAPAPRATGLTFTYRVTSSSADKRQREATSMLSTVRLQDGNIRMDYVEGLTPTGQKNGYVIVKGETGQFIIVAPKDKQAMIMTADAAGSGLGALMNNPMLKVTMSNQSFRFKDMGAGEPILGYKTRKVRTWYTSTLEYKVMMMPDQKITTSDSSDQWIATGIDMDAKNLENWAKRFGAGVKSTNPQLAADMQKYTNEYGRSGMALKTVTWSTQTDKKGKVTADTVTMEITDLKKGDIDASIFEIPKGYEVVDLSQMMAGVGAKMDSLNAEAAKGEQAGKDQKPSAKDALKSGLGGLLKKKKPPV